MVNSVAIFSGKGGVGKSTIAAALAQLSDSTLLDCDPQLSVSDWGDRRGSSPLVIATQLGRVPALLQQHKKIVIDTPGALVGNVITALQSVDLILVITSDRQLEIDALPATLQVASQANKPTAVLLNRLHPLTDPRSVFEILQAFDATACPVVIRERSAHYRAWTLGKTAAEYQPDGDAAHEVRQLWNWIQETY
ncbi:ParA family protein [Synechococcus elongatus]|uniref:ParA family protein n=1 Tax=Synechococcus elongatus TaxID=32046 RepID=UPI000F7F6B42|nr:ParA family protein [Synechococcus elongatus]